MSDLLGEIFVIVLLLGIPIWFSLKAKPLDLLPYRWATFVAIMSAIQTVRLFFGIMTAKQAIHTGMYLVAALFSILTSVGLFRRAKLGVVFLIAHCALVFLSPLIPNASNVYLAIVLSLILMIINVLYFKKRWKYMGSGWFAVILPFPKEP
jgi:hypothetical protein